MIKAIYLLAFAGAVLGYTDTRIINGQQAQNGDYPWQVSLQEVYSQSDSGYWHFCGGSLISENFVMTAAHCQKLPSRVTVYAGSVDKFNGGIRIGVTKFIAHPQYDANTISNDYGIIELKDSITYDNNPNINCIPIVGANTDATTEFPGNAVTSGWGYMVPNDPNALPDMLQVVNIDVLSDAECTRKWGSTYMSDSMICAGGDGTVGIATGAGVCSGDSGGPLVQVIDGVTTLIGATSWAPSTCTTRLPSGWAKLSSVRSWIVENTDLNTNACDAK